MTVEFLDTNVFVYMFDGRDARKRAIARDLVSSAVANVSATISFQVVNETLRVTTEALPSRLTADDAGRLLASILAPLWTVNPSEGLYREALRIQERYGYAFYDALIVAAALEAGCSRLLSEDLQDGHQIEGLTIVNPFAAPA